MEKKLTNEEIAKVFAMYLGAEFLYENGEPDNVVGVYDTLIYGNDADESGEGMFSVDECKLLLTPLSDITQDHALAIYCMGFTHCVNKELQIMPIKEWPNMRADQHQQLIVWGYAVKLHFGIDHWANGKTAIELGIAIES